MSVSEQAVLEIAERAVTLQERLQKLQAQQSIPEAPIQDGRAVIEQWRQNMAAGDDQLFCKRLQWEGLDEETAMACLTAKYYQHESELPAWTSTWKDIMHRSDVDGVYSFLDNAEPLPFEDLLADTVKLAEERLRKRAGSSVRLMSNSALTRLDRQLLQWLVQLHYESLQFEFQLYRAMAQWTDTSSAMQQSEESSDTIYRSFVRQWRDQDQVSFYKKYAVLAKLTALSVDFWVSAQVELLQRLHADLDDLNNRFAANQGLGIVRDIQGNYSDRHHQGRSVQIVTFESGVMIVYKPKSLALDRGFYELMSWINDQGFSLPFKTLTILDRGTYGWIEFVEHLPCDTHEQVRRYYERAGAALCLMHVLRATDCHYENIIVHGEHPCFIDLETLLTPKIHDLYPPQYRDARYAAYVYIDESVQSTAMLPNLTNIDGDDLDLGGLPAALGTKRMRTQLRFKDVNTDRMSLATERIAMPIPKNVPLLRNKSQASGMYKEEILKGFERMYRFILQHRTAWLDASGPLARFGAQPIRFVYRNTRLYVRLFKGVMQPEKLRNGIDFGIHLDKLYRVMVKSAAKPSVWPVAAWEIRQLSQMDIPYLHTETDENVIDLAGQLVQAFAKSGYERVLDKLRDMGERDLANQLLYIDGTIPSAGPSNRRTEPTTLPAHADGNFRLSKKSIIAHAKALAERLLDQAIRGEDGSLTWLTTSEGDERKRLLPMEEGLYNGQCGIAFLYAALYRITGKVGYREIAADALRMLRRTIIHEDARFYINRLGLGGASGIGSVIYSLARISALLDDPELLKDAIKSALLLSDDAIDNDEQFDVVQGSSGAIFGLLALYDIDGNEELLAKARRCGDRLLHGRGMAPTGHRVWKNAPSGQCLAGFSHGAAGIAAALTRLYHACGSSDYLEAAMEAVRYEQELYCKHEGRYPDLRFAQAEQGLYDAWCHGSAGIGLGRLAMRAVPDDAIRDELDRCIADSVAALNRGPAHLCCGALGRIELLLRADRVLDRPDLTDKAVQALSRLVSTAEAQGGYDLGGKPRHHPGFFQGVSGIAYELLRAAAPDRLPSVLSFE